MSKAGKHIKVIISGGGTGGHIYPAIAIADALKAADPATDLLFVGAEGRMEMEKVPQAGYPIVGLWISGLQRRLTLDNLSFPFKVVHSWWKARKIVRSFRPDVVVGVGGYASGPMMQAAIGAGVPTLLQEQNGYAGLTNKMLAPQVSAICVAYPNMGQYFPQEKLHFTGNPVRQDIAGLAGKQAEALAHFGLEAGKPVLLVLGGSLGARTLNEALLSGIDRLAGAGLQVVWQTGKYYYESVRQRLGAERPGVKVMPFVARMDLAYACADAVVSRAGALSISELSVAGKPAILVPSPNVTADHQTKNALALVQEQAAWLVADADAPEQLLPKVLELMADAPAREALALNIKKLGKPDAARHIAEQVRRLAGCLN